MLQTDPSGLDPKELRNPQTVRAVLLVEDSVNTREVDAACTARGIRVRLYHDPVQALMECRERPPDLAIVDEKVGNNSGIEFIARLLKVSWTTSAILITDADEATVHERTEGLGILGHVRRSVNRKAFDELLDVFDSLRA